MADETKTNATPEAPDGPTPTPPTPEQEEQSVIPGMDGGPAPGVVPPEQGAAGSVTEYTKQEWERPLEKIEAEQKKPCRGRTPKATPSGKANKASGKGKQVAPSKGAPPAPTKEEAPGSAA